MVRAVKYREVEKFLRQSQRHKKRTTGSHETWASADETLRVTVPHHKTVAPGIVRQIMNVVPNAPEKWR
jgi:predicted RNA binding protein YcfA (HicA-like mRNA interferase family)